MKVLATFATLDIANSMRDRLEEHGFNPHEVFIMANRIAEQPPEDAILEDGTETEKGMAGVEEKIGKTVNALFGKSNLMEGTGSEGEPKGGALLTLHVASQQEADRAVDLLTLHLAADVEVTETDADDLKDAGLQHKA